MTLYEEALQRFRAVLEECIRMDAATFAMWSQRACLYSQQQADDVTGIEANRQLFRGTRPNASGISAGSETR